MKKIGLLVSIMVFGFIAMADDYDKEIISWSDSLMSHCDPTRVWIGNETVYLENVTLPYVYACGAVLHKTAGGYRLDLPGIEISDLCIQANGDLAVFVTGENVVRVNSNRGDFTVEREGMFYSGLYAHNLFVFGPGKLTIVGDVDSKLYGTSGILCDPFFGDVKIGAGTTVDFQNLARGIYCQALDIVLARLRFAGVENGIEAHSVFLNASCVVGTCTGKGIFANNFIHVYQSIVDLQCSDNCFESGETIIFEAIVTLLSWNRNGIWSQGNIVMEDSEFSAYAGPKYCGVGTAQSLGIGDGRYRIVTGSEGAGIRGGYVVLSGGDVEVCSPNGVGCYLYSGMYEAASNSVYSGSFKTINRIDIEDLLTINLESAAFYGVSSALLSSDFYEFFADVGGKLLMSGVSTLATSVKYGRPKYGIVKPYDVSGLWVTADSGYVEMFDGTVLVDNAEIGVQVPLLSICGGSFNGSYSLYNNLKPIAVLMEDGQVVVKSLKCVKERFPDADSGSKIVSGWRTQLPPYYMTQSLYLDDDRSLYFWIPEDTEGEGSVMITFDPRGGDLSEGSRTVKKGSAVGTLPTPTRNKYKFNGWYTATTGGTKISAATKVDVDVTYYAQWTYVGSEADYPTCDLPTAFDNSKLTFTTGGNADWFGQGGVTHDGTDAARSGIIMHNQNSWMQTTVTGPGTFSFWWYASSEVNGGNWNDYLTFLIDGVQVDKIGGTSCSWTHCSYTLGAGSHTLKWNYLKNGSQDVGEDAGFVDQIVWEPVTTYTVSFNANGGAGTMANQTFTYGVSTVLKPNAFTKNGYTFAGWSKTAGGSVVYDDGALVSNLASPGGSITLYAVWTAVSSDFEIVNGMLTGYNGTGGAVTIPSGVTSIGDYVFRSCDGLTSVTIPEGVTSIGGDAFSYCSMLKSVTIPSSMMRIGNWAFDGCSSLASITIPEGVICIGEGAFYCCSGLTSVTIPSSVTIIGERAFDGCSGLESVTIPACVKSMSDVFPDAYQTIEKVVICDGVTSIDDWAFEECSSVTSVTIPEGVTSIGDYAFYYCTSLTSVTIPSSVTSIGYSAFEYCSSLTSVTIPEGVTSIGDYAFYYCTSLTSVTIPSSVTSIGRYAFSGCSSLTSVTILEGVTDIEYYAFHGCSALTSVTIPSSVTSIGSGAFEYCSSLEVVYVGSGDADRIAELLIDSGFDVSQIEFIATAGLANRYEFLPGEKVSIDTGLIGYRVSGLPSGLKYTSTTGIITGSVKTSTGADGKTVTFTKSGEDTLTTIIVIGEKPTISVMLAGDVEGCKVTGAGGYAVDTKVTLKATAPKGVVFMGWYGGGSVVATQATYTFTMGRKDIELVAKFKKEVMSVGCKGLSDKEYFPAGVTGAEGGIALDISTESGVKSIKVDKLPTGMKYDSKIGRIIGAPTKAGDNTVVITVTAVSGAVEKKEIKVAVEAMPVMAVGKFDGFVLAGKDNAGTFTLTTTDAGKLTAKVITTAGTISFSGTCWDTVKDGVYRATLTTKSGEKLALVLDSTAAWDANQLSGTFTTAAKAETARTAAVPSRSYSLVAQRNAFSKTWYFAAEGNEAMGWTFAYAKDSKTAAFTVTMKADGATVIAGKLPNGNDEKGREVFIKVSASGYANVGGLKEGVILADFAPVMTVNKVKKVLAIKTNLWFDCSDGEVMKYIGSAKFVE